jgi:hypothetical protein
MKTLDLNREPPRDVLIPDHAPSSVSDGAVGFYLVILLLVTAAAMFLFWAKMSNAWPFGP